ncbi:MAG: prephenate dehydrogenase/arogenate dehydrogenase family protein, partial [Patescibacteria group bacterium]
LYRLLKDDFLVTLYARKPAAFNDQKFSKGTVCTSNLEDAYKSEAIFFSVPISQFENVLASHRKYFKNHLLIDVLSVKMHPAEVLKKYLKGTKARAMLTHPMFGPDSSKEGFRGLPLVMDRFLAARGEYEFWKNFFRKKGLNVIEISAREHDRLAAGSQGVTHFMGRLLYEFGFKRTAIDTVGAKKLHEVEEQTVHDTWELFVNLQNYNPYTKAMRLKLGTAFDSLYNKLLPERARPGKVVFGIQGGEGSFNHEAILDYMQRRNIQNGQIEYLYTTEKVMAALHKGDIDFGLFAIHNSIGGIVDESIEAISRYKFSIVEEFAIPVRHHLMKRKDAAAKNIKTVMAHPQALKQCQGTLARKYPELKQVSGKGDLIDTARAARALSEGKIQKNMYILGPKKLSELFGLEIIARDLQDEKNNRTAFLLVR